jgi:hypothetical protein
MYGVDLKRVTSLLELCQCDSYCVNITILNFSLNPLAKCIDRSSSL